jgi:ankyrin repeat protein
MHKAAIDNNSYLLTYLRDYGKLKIDEQDYSGNTPLHFACSYGSEISTFWLLGFGQNPNVQNTDGDTPLHVLLKSQKLFNTKNVRELIFKGASRDLMNKLD